MSKNCFVDISGLSPHIEDDEYLMDGFSPSMSWSPSKFIEVYEEEDELTGIYNYRDIYEFVTSLGQDVSHPASSSHEMDLVNYWSSNGLSMETPSSNELALHFEELSPTQIHLGTDDIISEGEREGLLLVSAAQCKPQPYT